MKEKDKDIERVRREEQRRGKRPIDETALLTRKERLRLADKLLDLSDEAEVASRLVNEWKLPRGSDAFEAAMAVWRELRGLAPPQR